MKNSSDSHSTKSDSYSRMVTAEEKNRFEIKNDDDVVLLLTRLTHSAKCDPCHEIETELRVN